MQVRRLNNTRQVYLPGPFRQQQSGQRDIPADPNGSVYRAFPYGVRVQRRHGLPQSLDFRRLARQPHRQRRPRPPPGTYAIITGGPSLSVEYKNTCGPTNSYPHGHLDHSIGLSRQCRQSPRATCTPSDTYLGGGDNGCRVTLSITNGHRVVGLSRRRRDGLPVDQFDSFRVSIIESSASAAG